MPARFFCRSTVGMPTAPSARASDVRGAEPVCPWCCQSLVASLDSPYFGNFRSIHFDLQSAYALAKACTVTNHHHSRALNPGITVRVRHIEYREWWLRAFAVTVTLALAAGVISLSFPEYRPETDRWFWSNLREWVRALAGLVLIFDIYTVHQHLQLQRLRKQLAERNELFELITENAADMIAVVDSTGNRIYNSPAYQRILGYSPEDLEATPASEQVHPADRPRVLEAAENARVTGRGQRLLIVEPSSGAPSR